jgi:predicted regulator of Ras-like GTPase activity (Roadblock/LC7/MglB family)
MYPARKLMNTRQSELTDVLRKLAAEFPNPHWVALIDQDGLVMACVPPDPPVDLESISAMTAAGAAMGERVVDEIDGGDLRTVSVIGAKRQVLTVALTRDRLLSVGLDPSVPPHRVFGPLGDAVQDLARALRRRFTAD